MEGRDHVELDAADFDRSADVEPDGLQSLGRGVVGQLVDGHDLRARPLGDGESVAEVVAVVVGHADDVGGLDRLRFDGGGRISRQERIQEHEPASRDPDGGVSEKRDFERSVHPGGHVILLPPRRWKWMWNTSWPESRAVLRTIR